MVVPTCRPEQWDEFLEAWMPLFNKHGVRVIPVFDDEDYYAELPSFIPRHTDMIRSWGIYKAWRAGSDYTLTLDDDVRPGAGGRDPFEEYESVFRRGTVLSPYLSVGQFTSSDLEMRGFPYAHRKRVGVGIQYGGWDGTLDYDAATQLVEIPGRETFDRRVVTVPRGTPVTTCIMNAAWQTRLAPIMWQLPLFEGKYNRFGDIWSGLLQKKMLDALGLAMVINGRASVHHSRASDPLKNLERELPGIEINETLWEKIDYADGILVGESVEKYYQYLTNVFAQAFPPEYASKFKEARDGWLRLFA